MPTPSPADENRGGREAVGPDRARATHALTIALVLNLAFLAIEIAGAIAFNSLALIADAAHMASDVAGLGLALLANVISTRGGSARHTYGLQRAEVLAGQANGLLLLAAAAWVIYEALRRLDEPSQVMGGGVAAVAAVGLAVNVISALFVARAAGRSINMRGAFVHLVGDAAASAAALTAGVAILIFSASWLDSVASIVIGLMVVWAAWGLLRETAEILLEAAPRHLDPEAIEAAIASEDFVEAVHHLHVWNLASDVPALSAHVVISGEVTLHEAQLYGENVRRMLIQQFGIEHSTLELECHECEPQGATNTQP